MAHRLLVIDAHPDPDPARFCHVLALNYIDAARQGGADTRLITLADASFPTLRSAAEFAAEPESPAILSAREDVLWANHIAIIFPLWLGGAPSFLLAFFEQLGRGAFLLDTKSKKWRPRLRGKAVRVIVTMGMPALLYRTYFGSSGVTRLTRGVLGFAGAGPVRTTFFGLIEMGPARRQERFIAKVRALARADL